MIPNIIYKIAVCAFVIVRLSWASPITAPPLAVQLIEVLNDPRLPESPERSYLFTSLHARSGDINGILTGTYNGSNVTADPGRRVCQMWQILLANTEYVDSAYPDYINTTEVNWSQTSWLAPRCILQPSSAAGVAVSLKLVQFFGAKFAARSGGHNANSGFGSIGDSGILLDLKNLNHLNIESDHKTVRVGPGNRWIDVYEYLDKLELSAVGTKEPGPGVGGSILGGGDPFFPALHGLACDNVEDFEIILSNSTCIHANAAANPDLFRALKGGGPNFGFILPSIITTFTLYTVQSRETWYNVLTYSSASNTALFQALIDFQNRAEDDPKANVVFTLSGNMTVVGFLYAAHAAKPPIFSSFANISTMSTLIPSTNGTVKDLCTAIGLLDSPISAKREIAALSTSFTPALYQSANTDYQNFNSALPPTASLILSFQPVTRAAVQASQAHGINALGVEVRPQSWFAVVLQWTADAATDASQSLAGQFLDSLKSSASSRGLLLPFLYQNDAGFHQKPLSSIDAGNIALLKAVSKKYDAEQIFQKLQNGGFLLSQA